MSIDDAVVAQAIAAIASVTGAYMDPASLAEDSHILTLAFDDEESYKLAIVNTVKALKDISKGKVTPTALTGTYKGWSSYHYQPRVEQQASATMRVVFTLSGSSLYVLGFGHRSIPSDIYRRLSRFRLC